jgi:hypothetical protein
MIPWSEKDRYIDALYIDGCEIFQFFIHSSASDFISGFVIETNIVLTQKRVELSTTNARAFSICLLQSPSYLTFSSHPILMVSSQHWHSGCCSIAIQLAPQMKIEPSGQQTNV